MVYNSSHGLLPGSSMVYTFPPRSNGLLSSYAYTLIVICFLLSQRKLPDLLNASSGGDQLIHTERWITEAKRHLSVDEFQMLRREFFRFMYSRIMAIQVFLS